MNIIDEYRKNKFKKLSPVKESISKLISDIIDSTEDICYADLSDDLNESDSLIQCKIDKDYITFKCGSYSHLSTFDSKSIENLNILLTFEYLGQLRTDNDAFIDLNAGKISIFFACTNNGYGTEKDLILRNFVKDLKLMFPDYEILDELDEESDKKVSGYVVLKASI